MQWERDCLVLHITFMDVCVCFDYFYKIIVIGDECVGKTNFLLRISKGYYDPKPKTTYGVEFEFKNVPLPNSK